MEPDAGTLVAYANKHGQKALDGAGDNSPFTEALAKRILTPNLDVRRLFDLVRDDVMDVTNKRPQPFSYGSLSGRDDFYFVQKWCNCSPLILTSASSSALNKLQG